MYVPIQKRSKRSLDWKSLTAVRESERAFVKVNGDFHMNDWSIKNQYRKYALCMCRTTSHSMPHKNKDT